jgi:hypothetical protein
MNLIRVNIYIAYEFSYVCHTATETDLGNCPIYHIVTDKRKYHYETLTIYSFYGMFVVSSKELYKVFKGKGLR